MKRLFKVFIVMLISMTILGIHTNINASTTDETDENGIVTDSDILNGGIENRKTRSFGSVAYTGSAQKQEIANSIESGTYSLKSISARSLDYGNRRLAVPHRTQQNDYYCGPASLQMVLAYKGKNVSQSTLASQLGTTSQYGTPAGSNVANVLNYYLGNIYGWSWHSYWDIDGLRAKIVAGTTVGDPSVVNTLETPDDCYIKGHSQFPSIAHFGTTAGYNRNSDSTWYLDPGAGYYAGMYIEQLLPIWKLSYAAGGRGLAW